MVSSDATQKSPGIALMLFTEAVPPSDERGSGSLIFLISPNPQLDFCFSPANSMVFLTFSMMCAFALLTRGAGPTLFQPGRHRDLLSRSFRDKCAGAAAEGQG
ncbi:hypothetical protein [Xanthomonas oryzae]|uniref:hypothetical protein n=1 Tax=Xanthomonas oryzae TaxID=347 RepID=UPI002115DF97|nr:hypothetical protein [Xanthomonas oryzae]